MSHIAVQEVRGGKVVAPDFEVGAGMLALFRHGLVVAADREPKTGSDRWPAARRPARPTTSGSRRFSAAAE
ncbi:MAG: hypothetical protein U1E40_16990 [Amaricoccus sp.]